MPEDYEGHPQRRDFPIGGEPVLFTHNEPRVRGGGSERRRRGPRTPRSRTARSRTRTSSRTSSTPGDEELLTLNIGPHHPATHGVLRLLTTLEGEVVRDIKPIIGYVHTGIEKTAEDKSYWKVIPVIERMDYLAYYFNAMAFCGAVETLLDLEVPPRAQYLRVHPPRAQPDHVPPRVARRPARSTSARSRCSGTASATASRSSTCSRCPPASACTRATSRSAASSRTSRVGFAREGARVHRPDARRASTSSRRCSTRTRSCSQRLRGVAAVDEETLLDLGVTGPLLRATGNPWDLRKAAPYSSYDHFDFKIPVGTVGDNYDRYRVRMAEMQRVASKIIEQALDGLPEGAVHHREPQVRAAAAARAGDLDGGADPPLQARHRGLPRAAGRGLLPDRVARAASSAASCAPTAPPSRRACTCATRRS